MPFPETVRSGKGHLLAGSMPNLQISKTQVVPDNRDGTQRLLPKKMKKKRMSLNQLKQQQRSQRIITSAASTKRADTIGSFVAIATEQQIQKSRSKLQDTHACCFILLPDAPFRQKWDLFCLLLLLYVSIVTPFSISFLGDVIGAFHYWELLFFLDRFVDFVFLVDIVLNFRTAWIDQEGHTCFEWKECAARYAKSWLLIDIISVIPYDLIFLAVGGGSSESTSGGAGTLNLLKLLRILRVVKLARVLRASRILKRMEQKMAIKFGVLHLLTFFVKLLFLNHWMACGYYLMASVEDSHYSWINQPRFRTYTTFDMYLSSLYWAVMTTTTIGFGDIPAETTAERGFAIICMFIGAGMFSYVVGTMCSLIQGLEINKLAFERKMDSINEYMSISNYPKTLRRKIRSYLFYQRDTGSFIPSEAELYDSVSPALRSLCAYYKYEAVLRNVSFFKVAPQQVITELSLKLKHAIFMPGECIIKNNDVGHEMYFIFKGRANLEMLVDGEPMVVKQLEDGDHCGERGMIYSARRLFTARSLSFCDTCILTHDDYHSIMQYYPDVTAEVRHVVVRWMWRHLVVSGKLKEAFYRAANLPMTPPVSLDLNVMQTKIYELQGLLAKQMQYREAELDNQKKEFQKMKITLRDEGKEEIRKLRRESQRLTLKVREYSRMLEDSEGRSAITNDMTESGEVGSSKKSEETRTPDQLERSNSEIDHAVVLNHIMS